MGFFSGILANLPAEVDETFTVVGLGLTSILFFVGTKELWSVFNQFILGPIFGPGIDLKKQGDWAVVTGPTDGIGLEYAKKFAQAGLNVVLIGRTQAKLDKVAAIIEKFGVKTLKIRFDFTQTSDHYDVIRKELQGLDIGVLFNNVGCAEDQYIVAINELPNAEKRNIDILHTNVVSNYMMTSIVLPGMKRRRRGVIVNNNSSTAQIAVPYLQIYPATKAFTDHFTQCVALECESHGVVFQSLMPNVVRTKMVDRTEVSVNWLIPTPEKYVNAAFNTIGRAKKTSGYFPHHLVSVLITLLGQTKSYRLLVENSFIRLHEKHLKEVVQSHQQ